MNKPDELAELNLTPFVPYIAVVLAPPAAGKSTYVRVTHQALMASHKGYLQHDGHTLLVDADDVPVIANIYRELSSLAPGWCNLPQYSPLVRAKNLSMRAAAADIRRLFERWHSHAVVFTAEHHLATALAFDTMRAFSNVPEIHDVLSVVVPNLTDYRARAKRRREEAPSRWTPSDDQIDLARRKFDDFAHTQRLHASESIDRAASMLRMRMSSMFRAS